MAQWDYFILRGALDPEKDRERIEHIKNHFDLDDRKQVDVVRELIDTHKKVIETVGSPDNLGNHRLPGIAEILRKLENIKVVAANGGDISAEVEEVKGGFNFGGDEFSFGDEE